MEAICHFFRTNYILANCEDVISKKAFSLNLSHYQMAELPEIIKRCDTLMKLYLNQNILTKVPSSLGNLFRLQVLALDYNKLTEFPMCICQLVRLKFLNVSCNNIICLPPELGNLTALETFWCNNTGLRILPAEISNCERLQTLGVRGNRLRTLPSSMGTLSELRWFTAENNELSEVPSTFGLLQNLVHLNLKENQLSRFPRLLISMPNLKFVFLNQNLIVDAPTRSDLEQLQFLRMLNLSKNPISTQAELQKLAQQQTNIYVEMSDDLLHDSAITLGRYSPNTQEEANANPNHESSSDWANSVRTSQLDSSDESTLENTIEDISVMLPEMSRYVTTF
ncbi:leucine-rich repeat-containing protein 10 [Drosophila innubila]|uniref:leucine-rich repeat-containing protein 10 n=1 Tax=Drosophila innubila TaxID=198719 RepID=UPI00148C7956|nr:leucine-rich repeat-containing protein 10 [Drosophila innubila]